MSPESHRPLEKDLEGTAAAWASEEDCSEGRKQRLWMPQLGFFWSQKGVFRSGRCFWYSSSETTNYVFPDVGPSVYEMRKIMYPLQSCDSKWRVSTTW